MADVQPVHQGQPDVPVDAAAGVPPGVGLPLVVHSHRDHVHAPNQVPGDVVGEADVAVGPFAQMNAVDPDVAVHVHAVELEPRIAITGTGRQAKGLPVPAGAGREVAHPAAAGRIFPRSPFDAPVMRQVERAPAAIIERRPLRSCGITQGEAPARVHGEALPLRIDGARGRGDKKAHHGNTEDTEETRNCQRIPLLLTD